jgi:integrase
MEAAIKLKTQEHASTFVQYWMTGDKKGNNVYCELPPEALAIVKSIPRDEESVLGNERASVKQTGERSAGNLHAAFDEAGAGNVARSRWCDTRRRKGETTGNTNFDLHRRASPRPYRYRIFPYSTDAIGAAFTRACRILGIEDLRFHDLRHEGISRLFEMGKTIPQAAAVSGHRSWTNLKRYTHIRQSRDKYQNWKWKAMASADSV